MEYNIPIKEGGLEKAILMLMNPMLNLTNQERHLLSIILKTGKPVLTTKDKIAMREASGYGEFRMNNYIKGLKDKKILTTIAPRTLQVNPNIIKMVSEPKLVINFNIAPE